MYCKQADKSSWQAEVIIIGGGIQACTAAFYLAKRGIKSLILEKNRIGQSASGVNAGGLRRLARDPEELPLAQAAMEIWWEIDKIISDGCDASFDGQVKIAENREDLFELEKRATLSASLGYNFEQLLNQSQLKSLIPGLGTSCLGGLYSSKDGSINPFRAVIGFKNCAEKIGACFYENTNVIDIEKGPQFDVFTNRGRFRSDILINCSGAWGGEIAAKLGEPVRVSKEAPMSMITNRASTIMNPVIWAPERRLSLKQFKNGTILIGGADRASIDFNTGKIRLDLKGLSRRANAAIDLFPAMKNLTLIRSWSGVDGYLPDQIPIIGPSSNTPGLFHAFAFCGHGFQLAPAVGKILSELVIDGRSSLPIKAFSIRRHLTN